MQVDVDSYYEESKPFFLSHMFMIGIWPTFFNVCGLDCLKQASLVTTFAQFRSCVLGNLYSLGVHLV